MALSPPIGNRVFPSEGLPAKNPDSLTNDTAMRGSPYNEAFAYAPLVGKYPLVLEGSYFQARTPTPGTGVSDTVKTSFSETVPMIFGNLLSTSPKRVWLDYIKIIVTAAAASSTQALFAIKTDTVNRGTTTNHWTAATVYNPVASSIVTLNYQSSSTASALTASSANAAVVGEASLGGITVVGDAYLFEFGQAGLAGSSGLTAAQATDPGVKVISMPPVVVTAGGSFTFYSWFPGNSITPLSYSFEAAWIER